MAKFPQGCLPRLFEVEWLAQRWASEKLFADSHSTVHRLHGLAANPGRLGYTALLLHNDGGCVLFAFRFALA
jgi:hypothetical protein